MLPRHRPLSIHRLLKPASFWNHVCLNADHDVQTLEERIVLNPKQWRSDAAYDYLDDLDTEGLAWECLRRNAGYQDEYTAANTKLADSSVVDDLIRQHWGLRFRYEPRAFRARRNHLLGTGSGYRARAFDADRANDRSSHGSAALA